MINKKSLSLFGFFLVLFAQNSMAMQPSVSFLYEVADKDTCEYCRRECNVVPCMDCAFCASEIVDEAGIEGNNFLNQAMNSFNKQYKDKKNYTKPEHVKVVLSKAVEDDVEARKFFVKVWPPQKSICAIERRHLMSGIYPKDAIINKLRQKIRDEEKKRKEEQEAQEYYELVRQGKAMPNACNVQ
jgi:hypothetical protein